MHKPPPLLNPHRTARVIRWAVLMLAWLAALFSADPPHANRRRIRQRYGFLSLTSAYRLLRAIVIVRSVQLTGLRARPLPLPRNHAPAGLHRRAHRTASLRAIFGASARKALRAGTTLERIRRLIAAFSDIDGFTRRYIVPRALKGLTRLRATIAIAPPADALRTRDAPALAHTDTS